MGQADVNDLVPLYLYEGKYLYAHGTEFGLHACRDDTFTLDLGARYQFLKLDPDPEDPFFHGVLERKQTVEAGVNTSMRGGWGILQLGWWTDVQDRHDGSEFELTYRYRFDIGKFMVSPCVSAKWLDADMVGYYFGVSPGESRPDLPIYAPGDAVNSAGRPLQPVPGQPGHATGRPELSSGHPVSRRGGDGHLQDRPYRI